MAAKRAGLSNRLEEEKAAPVSRPIDALIKPKEEKEKERKQEREEIEKKNRERYLSYKKPMRKTFLFDPLTIEAIRLFTFKNRKGMSNAMMDMLLRYIPPEIWIEARNNIIDAEQTPADYLEDLEKLDIDSIYYHDYKPSTK